jgi:hypothetical protein
LNLWTAPVFSLISHIMHQFLAEFGIERDDLESFGKILKKHIVFLFICNLSAICTFNPYSDSISSPNFILILLLRQRPSHGLRGL